MAGFGKTTATGRGWPGIGKARAGRRAAERLGILLAVALIALPAGRALAQPTGGEQAGEAVESGEVDASSEEAADIEGGEAAASTDADVVAESEDEEAETDIGAPLGLTILGTASLVGGILYIVESSETEDEADQAAATDPLREAQLRDRSDTESTLGIVLTTLGVAMAGGATYLWLTLDGDDAAEGEDAATTEGEVWLAPSLSGQGDLGLTFGGTF